MYESLNKIDCLGERVMKKSVLHKSLIIAAVTCSIGGSIALLPKQSKTAEALSIFKESDSVAVQEEYKIDENLQADDRTGILLTAQQSGANIDFVSAISGAFEMDFRVFSQTSPSEEELENKMFYPTSDLQSMSIIFTDANDENNTFSIVIESSTALGAIPTAHVEVQGKSLGIFRLARTYWAGYGVYNEPNPFDR